MSDVLLFSTRTSVGVFEIRTPADTFEITGHTYGCTYTLQFDNQPNYARPFPSPYAAIVAVAQHRTGIDKWDLSKEQVSDYAPNWTRHIDDRFRMQLLDKYLERKPECSYRQLVDYFEHKHGYALDRSQIQELLEELYVTEQLDRPLNDHMTPSELKQLASLIKQWRESRDRRCTE